MTPYNKLDLDEDRIVHLYVGNGMSTYAIAALMGCSHTAIKNRLVKNGIALRKAAEASRQPIRDAICTGHGHIQGSFWGNIRRGAKIRDLKFEVTIQQAWNLFEQQKRLCAITGEPIFFARTNREHQTGFSTASLDRIDSSLSYTIDNVWWVHKDINWMKSDFTMARFYELCHKVIQHKELINGTST